jgi:hypothetical protein
MADISNWRASVLRSNNKPAGGAGWGGPAKGVGVPKPLQAFTNPREGGGVMAMDTNSDPAAQAYRQDRQSKARLRREQHDKHLDRLNEIALGLAVGTAPDLSVSIAAAREFGDRVVGKAVQTVNSTLSGPDGGPVQTVGIATDDPVQAARVYQHLIHGTD